MYTSDYSKFCNENTVLEWRTRSCGEKKITNLNIPKLIELFGKPEIDPIHFRKLLHSIYYKRSIESNDLNIEYQTQAFDCFVQPFIHWNILDKNDQLEAIVYIEFYYEHNERTSRYPERNLEIDHFFNTELINNPNYEIYKKQLIEDFIQFKPFEKKNYPDLCLDEFDFTLEYLHSKYVVWNINCKNKETYDKLSFLLEFKEFEFDRDMDKM
jgi:hypothetical protein